ncbi:MAG: hypothetical protein JWM10_4608, partial [Myxococcaceae bacterium]|nr:hypothetical protein [Myxococcaceae bacterium]
MGAPLKPREGGEGDGADGAAG